MSTTSGKQSSSTNIVAFSLTPDQQKLITLEKLNDQKTLISVLTLKFWSRTTEDLSDFQLDQVSHINSGDRDCLDASIAAISNTVVAVSLGQKEVKIWNSS